MSSKIMMSLVFMIYLELIHGKEKVCQFSCKNTLKVLNFADRKFRDFRDFG